MGSQNIRKLWLRRFTGEEHARHFKLVYGRELGEKLKKVTVIMDRGSKKYGKKHREYGHNRKFISKNFKKKEERICAYVHNLGDFFQDAIRPIIKNISIEFQKGKLEPPYYEQFQNGKWGWDIKKKALNDTIEECSRNFIKLLKNKKNRL